MRLRSLSLLITLLSWIPFTSADEVSLLERQAVLIAGKHDTDVLLVAQTGIYAIENTLTKRLAFGAIFALSPAPILSNDREYLASLAKKGGKSNLLHLYNLGWRREHIIQLPDTPTAWGWNPASSKIAIATGTGICELSIETDQIIPFPIQTQSPIHTLLYAPDEENLLAASNNEITLVNSQSKNITAVIPFPDAKSMSCSWVSNRHFALSIATHGPDSFVYLYEIDPSGALTIQPKQLAASGTVGEFQNVALLPFGKILAFGMEILSPSDFFDQNAPVTLSYIPHFHTLDIETSEPSTPKKNKTFAWAPKEFRYAFITRQTNKNQKNARWALYASRNTSPWKNQFPEPPIHTSQTPITDLCWSQDGKTLYALTQDPRKFISVRSFPMDQ
jgi:hypothetical protein